MRKTETILKERQKQHGSFKTHAEAEVGLQRVVQEAGLYYSQATAVQDIGLQMILHKVARIISGGLNHSDSWEDIAGYATLVAKDMADE